MRQLINRPLLYFVLGSAVLVLLVSQFRKSNDTNELVGQLDLLKSYSGSPDQNQASDFGAQLAPNVAQAQKSQHLLGQTDQESQLQLPDDSVSMGNIADVSDPYGDAASAATGGFVEMVQDVPPPPVPQTLLQLEQSNSVEAMTVMELEVPDVDLGTTSSEIGMTGTASDMASSDNGMESDRYVLDVDSASEEPETIDAPSPAPARSARAIVKRPADVNQSSSLRARGWRKNPFIGKADGNDMAVTEAVDVDQSMMRLPAMDDADSIEIELDQSIVLDLDESEPTSAVASFESSNTHLSGSSIPTTIENPSPSVPLSSDSEIVSMGSVESMGTTELPIVVGLQDSVAHKAVHNIEYGKSLTRRGAAYAARQEFYGSLRILAQAHDTQAGGTGYTRALREGIIALKEAEDFSVSDTESQIGLSVGAIIEGHETKLISNQEASQMTAIGAMQRYFSFASNQLRVATGQNVVAAEALYCLGKLHTVQAKFGRNSSKLDFAKAIVFHQTALSADRSNYRSANELGVLFANSGRMDESQKLLKQSLLIQQMPEAWKNLAVVHQRAGEPQLAILAHKEFLIASQQQATGGQNTIRWIEPATFNQGAPIGFTQRAAQPPQNAAERTAAKPTIGQRVKDALDFRR